MTVLDVNYVMRSKNRRRFLEALEKEPKTNSYLSRELNIDISNIRKLIVDLEEKDFIVCKNPDDFHFKLYGLSRKGRKILKQVKKLD